MVFARSLILALAVALAPVAAFAASATFTAAGTYPIEAAVSPYTVFSGSVTVSVGGSTDPFAAGIAGPNLPFAHYDSTADGTTLIDDPNFSVGGCQSGLAGDWRLHDLRPAELPRFGGRTA